MSKPKASETEFLNKLREKQLEISTVPVQDLGGANSFYRSLKPYLKNSPWKLIIVLGILLIILIRIMFGNSFVHVVSTLQEGF